MEPSSSTWRSPDELTPIENSDEVADGAPKAKSKERAERECDGCPEAECPPERHRERERSQSHLEEAQHHARVGQGRYMYHQLVNLQKK